MMAQTAEDSPAAIAALTCTETDALFQVKYNITEDEWDSFSYRSPPTLSLRGDGVVYEKFADLTDYEACLPRDECSEVLVFGLPTDAYKFSFDGKAVAVGAEFIFDAKNPATTTEVGNCNKPICKDTEALIEVQFWNIGPILHSYRVEDKDGRIVLHDELVSENKYTVRKSYACVPKDNACYTFLIGGMMQWDDDVVGRPSYSLFFYGKLVRRSDSWLFDSVQFGDSCEPHCNQDDESLVEFFMYDDLNRHFEVEYAYQWHLSVVDRYYSSLHSFEVVSAGEMLFHRIWCIPKDSCSSFYISSPYVTMEVVQLHPSTDWNGGTSWVNVTVNVPMQLSPVYTLTMDNISYRKVHWMTQSQIGSDNQTTNMGSCTVGGLCDERNQDLFDLGFRTPVKYEKKPYDSSFPTMKLPIIGADQVRWYFENGNDNWLLQGEEYFNRGYDLNSSYGVIDCVPKDGCDMSFKITAESPVESYTVKKNGMQLDATQGESEFVTPFGQNCSLSFSNPTSNNSPSNSLSGGAIAGIVIACVAAVGAVVFLLSLVKRCHSQSSKGGEEDPLHTVLL